MTKSKKKAGSILSHLCLYLLFVFLYLSLIFMLLQFLGSFPFGKSSTDTLHPVNASVSPAKLTVILDPGHGGEDGGTVGWADGNEVYEKDLNLAISLLLRDMLEADGVNVTMTRERDVLLYDRNVNFEGRKKVLDLAARLAIGQKTENALFVSIHMNAYPVAKYSGLQVYYSPNHAYSETLADVIQTTVSSHLQPDNHRKIKASSDNIFLLDRLRCPAVLVECGFLSNPEECSALTRQDYQQKLAFLLYCSIRQSLSSFDAANSMAGCTFLKNRTILPAKPLIFGTSCGIMKTNKQQRTGKNNERYQNNFYMFLLRIPQYQMVGEMPLLRCMEFLP